MRPSPQPRGFPGKGGGTGNAGGRVRKGLRGRRAPAPRPQFPMTRLQKPRRASPRLRCPVSLPSPCPGAGLSPPRIPTGGHGGASGRGVGWAKGLRRGGPPRPAPSSPRLRQHRGWGRAVPGRPGDRPPREGRGSGSGRGWGRAGPRQPPLRSLGVPSGGPEAALAGEGEGRAAGSVLSHRVLSTVTPSLSEGAGGELGWREREGYPGEEAPAGMLCWSEPSFRGSGGSPFSERLPAGADGR